MQRLIRHKVGNEMYSLRSKFSSLLPDLEIVGSCMHVYTDGFGIRIGTGSTFDYTDTDRVISNFAHSPIGRLQFETYNQVREDIKCNRLKLNSGSILSSTTGNSVSDTGGLSWMYTMWRSICSIFKLTGFR